MFKTARQLQEEEDELIQERRNRLKRFKISCENNPLFKNKLSNNEGLDNDEASNEHTLLNQVDQTSQEILPDDMFADDFDTGTAVLQSKPVVRAGDNPALADNWDDAEGYYNIILGEVLKERYHVYCNLGKGVFSNVVRAKDTLLDKDVAIKIIRNNELMTKAGEKEWELLERCKNMDDLDKKHVVRGLDRFEYRGHLCLVFENLEMDLRSVIKKFGKGNGLNIKAVRVYSQHLFKALSLLKTCNIIHADIKPDNMLVTKNKNTLKLCDLGSASDVSENEITPYLVSRFYRAPEISIPYDFAIDVWSVCCSIYELYTGKILFPGKTNNHMLSLMMGLKGKIPHKVLKKGQFTSKHFDEDFNFMQEDTDKITGNMIVRVLSNIKPTRELRDILLVDTSCMTDEEQRLVSYFVDFLDKGLNLNPEKRLTVKDALIHPFIYGSIDKT